MGTEMPNILQSGFDDSGSFEVASRRVVKSGRGSFSREGLKARIASIFGVLRGLETDRFPGGNFLSFEF